MTKTIGFAQAPVRSEASAVAATEQSVRGRNSETRSEPSRRRLQASYDAAATNDQNRNHWVNADALSARAAHSPAVRRLLRMRARYEVANSPLAHGILCKLANFVVGTGPRLQVKTPVRAYNRFIETEFSRWSVKIKFARKLRQLRFSKAQSGEGFARYFTNYPLRTPVKLDLKTIEADQVADPTFIAAEATASDGILFDDFGNPLAYKVLKTHPGDTFLWQGSPTDFTPEKAADIVHYFTAERPGQTRGVPEITPALPIFAYRRRYMLAVVAAAETAANNAGVIESQSAAVDPDSAPEPLDTIDLDRNSFSVLPEGWKISQLKAEQPTTTFEMFDRALIREIARCVDMPYGVAAGDSSPYNFASGKLDLTPWYQTVRIEQDQLEDDVVDPTFERWYAEARLVPDYLPPAPAGLDVRTAPPHAWFWDGLDLLDPREVGAKTEGIRGGINTFGRSWARQGFDVTDEWEAEAELLGMSLEEYRALIIQNTFGPQRQAAAQQPAPGDPHADL